jgi:hypothetical protein
MVLFYVDDSGDERLRTFSAVGVPVVHWNAASARWLAWRRQLHAEHGVDVNYRLHAINWVSGRGRPTPDPRAVVNRSRAARWRIYVSALDVLAAIPGLVVLTVARPDRERADTYRQLMQRIDSLLATHGRHGLIVVDGDSPELRTLHGELDPVARRLVEDPWKRDARVSQWLQAADLVAYAAYQHVARRPDRAFMWHWYERHLGERIVGENAKGPPRGDPFETSGRIEAPPTPAARTCGPRR